MSIILFFNVGNRDVQLDGRPLHPPRPAGQQLLADVAQARGRLTFPIATAVIQAALALPGGFIDQLVFIGTDQQDERYRDGDTLHFAELLRQVIPGQFPGQIGQTEALTIGHGRNPSLYDEAWLEFKRVLRPYATHTDATCIVAPAGGIPACNTALILQGIHLFGERCHIYYQTPDGPVIPLDIGGQVLGLLRQNSINEALRRFDFTTAARLYAAGEWSPAPGTPRLVQALLEYGAARLRFDFQSAQSQLRQAIAASSGQTRVHLQQTQQELERLTAGDALARIAELFHNARIAWDNGRYSEFLSQATRFQTAVWQQQLPLLFPAQPAPLSETELRSLPVQPGWRRLLLQQFKTAAAAPPTLAAADPPPELLPHLDQYFNRSELRALCFNLGIDDEHLAGEEKIGLIISLITYMHRRGRLPELIHAAAQQRPAVAWFQQPTTAAQNQATIAAALSRLDVLMELHAGSISGFGYQGISPEMIAAVYPRLENGETVSPVSDMAAICLALGIPLVNPFLDTCALISGLLDE